MTKQGLRNRFNNILLDYIVPVIILLAVAFLIFGKVIMISSPKSDTDMTFHSLSEGVDHYYEFKTAWKPRLFSNALAAFTARVSGWLLARWDIPMIKRPLELTVGLWTTGWFLLTSSVLVFALKRRSIFYFFGLYAGISFGYMTRLRQSARIYPWDMPALFFYTLFIVLFTNKKYWWIFFIIPFCSGFKETVIVLCLAFLFADVPWKQRIGMVVGSLVLSIAVKIGIDIYTHGPLFFTMETRLGGEATAGIHFFENMWVFKGFLPYFANAGTLLAFIILPIVNKNVLYLKLLAIPFILGILFFGVADEYRIWFELIPFALYAIDTAMYGDLSTQQDVTALV